MASYLFFDDQRLLVREGFEREVGHPTLCPDTLFCVNGAQVSGSMCRVWKENDTSYHMIYQAFLPGEGQVLLAAHSEDGLHFTPRNTAREAGIQDPLYENQLLEGTDFEIAAFIDTGKTPGRLKLLLSRYEDSAVAPDLYESDDAIHWTRTPYRWHERGTEPVASMLYSKEFGEYVLLSRPMWGVRLVCESRTKDFTRFTTPQVILQADALDKPLTEIYGVFGFPYKDMYVGLATMYETVPSDTWKFMEGTISGQLAYSFNGVHWMRTLRTPLMRLEPPFTGMVFTSDMRQDDDGSILLYASGTPRFHGHFRESGAAIGVYRLREDGFIALVCDGQGRLRTRETLLGDELTVNITAEKATCALFEITGDPIEGFGHEDCVPFSGDSTRWTPQFKGDLSSLKGRIVLIEIKAENGRLFAINGDFTKLMNTEAWRMNKFGHI